MNKKGFVAKDFIIAMLLFSGALALLVLMVGALANDYDNPNIVDQNFSDKFDRFSEDTETASQMWDSLTSEGGLSLVGTVDLLFFATFRVISLIFSSVVSAGMQMAGFGEYFGVPTEITAIFMVLLFSILTVIIVFIVMNSTKSGKEL